MNIIKRLILATIMLMAYEPLFADDQQNGQIGLDISHDKVDILKAAIESGELDPNQMPNGSLITPLGLAIEKGSRKCIDYLLSLSSVDIHATYYVIYVGGGGSKSNHNSLFSAVKFGDIETANMLLDRGVEADYLCRELYQDGTFRSNITTLVISMYLDETPDARALTQRLADATSQINRSFAYDATPSEKESLLPTVSLLYRLICEANDNHAYHNDMIISLIERGTKDNIYFTPVDASDAIIKQNTSAENYAAYKAAQKYQYMSPLLAAAQTGNHELMRYLIEESHVPYDRYEDKGALVFASCKTTACIEVMLDQGVDIHTAHPAAGMPVLFSAVTSENYELMEGLLKNGADQNVTVNGYTVNDMIRSYPKKRQKQVVAILEKYQ
ncbi:MAG: ankyrin repeat domain-containing protein [Rikenellaceae bacterium]